MRYFLITCPRGHCGICQETEITFAFEAANLIEAMDKAKRMPSVKHTRSILKGVEIDKQTYLEYRAVSAYDRRPQGRSKRNAYR